MPTLTTGKQAVVMFEKALETFEHQSMMLELVDFYQPDSGMMQNAGNVIWRPVQQHARIFDGWDVSGEETGIIEETYPAFLGDPSNDFVKQRIDDLRDISYWERRAEQSGLQMATEVNKDIAAAIGTQGSLAYDKDTDSGFEFVSEAQTIMNERELPKTRRCFLFNDRASNFFAADLAGRQTIKGRPAETWNTGQIGSNVAGFDIFEGSFLPSHTKSDINIYGVSTPTRINGTQSFVPEAGSVNQATGQVTNVDYRVAVIPYTPDGLGGTFTVGDKIIFRDTTSGNKVLSLALATKEPTSSPMTFTVIDKDEIVNTVTIYPKPIAYLDPVIIGKLEEAYSNTYNTLINQLGIYSFTDVTTPRRTNLFWDKGAVEVLGGSIPADKAKEFEGMKVISSTMKNGLPMFMFYDGEIEELTFRYRLFCWYSVIIKNPSNCGIAMHPNLS
jgi:hypothetical protein